ncbi:hypothetical protein CDAR_311401 [Caerostris darwini]|uniref:Uncharacterized protein n=1 Tax=Caerostris darwini TaxID=1538125 RepID=A0AAV4UTJ0_9ARAC|nr:hypothetical protein CDAR_311401 [Caerostris darwini]
MRGGARKISPHHSFTASVPCVVHSPPSLPLSGSTFDSIGVVLRMTHPLQHHVAQCGAFRDTGGGGGCKGASIPERTTLSGYFAPPFLSILSFICHSLHT